jgi:hypothetical protein
MFAFEHECTECILVHNNWIVGSWGKEMRCVDATP